VPESPTPGVKPGVREVVTQPGSVTPGVQPDERKVIIVPGSSVKPGVKPGVPEVVTETPGVQPQERQVIIVPGSSTPGVQPEGGRVIIVPESSAKPGVPQAVTEPRPCVKDDAIRTENAELKRELQEARAALRGRQAPAAAIPCKTGGLPVPAGYHLDDAAVPTPPPPATPAGIKQDAVKYYNFFYYFYYFYIYMDLRESGLVCPEAAKQAQDLASFYAADQMSHMHAWTVDPLTATPCPPQLSQVLLDAKVLSANQQQLEQREGAVLLERLLHQHGLAAQRDMLSSLLLPTLIQVKHHVRTVVDTIHKKRATADVEDVHLGRQSRRAARRKSGTRGFLQ